MARAPPGRSSFLRLAQDGRNLLFAEPHLFMQMPSGQDALEIIQRRGLSESSSSVEPMADCRPWAPAGFIDRDYYTR
jgi:hypothetical protein